MKVLIIRHGESEADLLDVHEGRADYELTETGHKQAQAMAEYVHKNFKIDMIYASPLKRAAQTATHLSETTHVQVILDPNLMEFNNGLLAGLSRKEAAEKYPEIIGLPNDQAVYGQESKIEFRNRANQFLNKLLNEEDMDKTVAVISHGGMINQLYASLINTPIDSPIVFGTGDTGIHVWRWECNRTVILKSNLTNHIS